MRLFSNAVVRTFSGASDTDSEPPNAILVDSGTIVAVGDREELLALASTSDGPTPTTPTANTSITPATRHNTPSTPTPTSADVEEIDCGGQTIIPGLVDGHMHSNSYADSLTNLDLSPASSFAEAVDLIRGRSQSVPAGEWVLGSGWDANTWSDADVPDRELLDRAVPNHPVAMWSVDHHTLWVNHRALEIAGLDARTPNPSGGQFDRDIHGDLTGVIREEATSVLWQVIPLPSPEERVDRLEAAQQLFLSLGLTGFHDFDGAESTRGWADMRARGKQHIRVMKYLRGEELEWAIDSGWRTGNGDGWLVNGGLKLFSDGALGSHTSHMSSPYPDPVLQTAAPDGSPTDSAAEMVANYGIAQMTEDELFDQARRATEAGISVAIHAIGDQANHHVLNVFDRLRPITVAAEARLGRALRHRVEHAQFIQPADVARFHELQVIASMQPRHCISDLHLLHLIDEEAQLAAYAWPDLLEARAQVVFGSDGPVEPANPFAAIYAAMTRADISGDPTTTFQSSRRLSAAEAIRLHTQGPAYAAGLEHRRGVLAPGMDADFIVIDTDPLRADGLMTSAEADVEFGTSATAEAGLGLRTPTPAKAGVGLSRSEGLLGYRSERALFDHAEAIRDTRVAMTVVAGEIKHSI